METSTQYSGGVKERLEIGSLVKFAVKYTYIYIDMERRQSRWGISPDRIFNRYMNSYTFQSTRKRWLEGLATHPGMTPKPNPSLYNQKTHTQGMENGTMMDRKNMLISTI